MSLAGFKVIDADGHVTEPATLYTTHIDPKFRAASNKMLSALGAGNLGLVPALYPKWRSAERPLGERAMASAIGGGLLERYPKLMLGFFEGGISWVPWWAERMDAHYKHFARHTPHLTRKPS